jgi:hypothetical protein
MSLRIQAKRKGTNMLEFKPITLATKEQTERLFKEWECAEPLPKAKRAVYIAFPNRTSIRCTKTTEKGTDGRLLYLIEFAAG